MCHQHISYTLVRILVQPPPRAPVPMIHITFTWPRTPYTSTYLPSVHSLSPSLSSPWCTEIESLRLKHRITVNQKPRDI